MVRCDNGHTYGQMIVLMDVQVLDGVVFVVCHDNFRGSGKFMLMKGMVWCTPVQ